MGNLFGKALDVGAYATKGVGQLLADDGAGIVGKFATDYSEVALNMAKGYKANATKAAKGAGETILQQAFRNASDMDSATKAALRKEFFEGVRENDKVIKQGFNQVIRESGKDAKPVKEYLENFAAKHNVTDSDAIIDRVSDAYTKMNIFDSEYKAADKIVSNTEKQQALKDLVTGPQGGMTRTAKAYFGDERYGAGRMVGVGAAWMGASVTGRLISGGNAVRNNRGESDIAGIPFV